MSVIVEMGREIVPTVGLIYRMCFGNVAEGEVMVLHSAVDSAIGYYFQGAYALVRLLSIDDEDAAISIETLEDVVLEGANPTLHQLKHSLSPGVLSEQNDGLWKTLRIWIEFKNQENIRFQYVTTASIKHGCTLSELTKDNPDHALVLDALNKEAERVKASREKNTAEKKTPGFEDRWPGCESYLKLDSNDRLKLLRRIKIAPDSFSAADIKKEVEKRLATTPHTIKNKVAERLIEWWDRQTALSLLGKRERILRKSELLYQLQDISSILHGKDGLSDDFSHLSPPVGTEPSRKLRQQIELINGSDRLLKRATVEHWRARNQRDRWISEGLPVIDSLNRFDEKLIEEWRDRHEELREKVQANEQDATTGGRALLEWTHRDAPKELPPIRHDWSQPHLVRGSYQMLAERVSVGWHPDFASLMAADDSKSRQ